MKSIIVYSTKYGSVEKASKMLKEKLKGEVALVNIMKEKAPSLEGYDTVILGGSVYVGKVQKELTGYISKNLSELTKKRIGLFICGALKENEKLAEEFNNAFPEELYDKALAKEVFGYEFNFEKMSFIDKMATEKIIGIKSSVSEFKEDIIDSFAKVMNFEG
jgi:menaquinone-dependent protoporphyrinogen oxidase